MAEASGDEYDDLYEYDSALEHEIQRLESQMPSHSQNQAASSATITIEHQGAGQNQSPSKQASADISDAFGPPLSQQSACEEDLVEQVTELLHKDETEEEGRFSEQSQDQVVPANTTFEKDNRSLFERFRKREFFSVSDLVAPLWCEVQYDYRLRSKPYLKAEERPEIITTREGKEIPVNKVKAGDHEKIMKRGEAVHKKLEKEIHPVEIKVTTSTREDVWGLRFLNMLSSLQALLDIGKCRELPVVGFLKGFMVVGVIDELVLEPLDSPETASQDPARTPNQSLLTSFFASGPTRTKSHTGSRRTARLYVSDSKTRASGTMPRVESAMSGTMQLMSYKEILDGMLAADNRRGPIEPSDARMQGLGSGDAFNGSQDCPISLEEEEDERSPVMAVDIDVSSDRPYDRFSWYLLFRHLNLDPCAKFSSHFLEESRTIVIGNALEADLLSGTCLWDYVDSWVRYVAKLGLGKAETPGSTGNLGRSEDKLELVYRNVKVSTSKKEKSKRSKRNKSRCTTDDVDSTQVEAVLFNPTEEDTNALQTKEEERLIALAIAESLKQDSQEVSLPDEKITVEVNPTELEGLQATLLPAGCCVAEQDPATIPASDSTFVVKEEAPASQAIDLTSSPPAISSGIEPVVLLQEPKSPIKSKKTKRKRPQAGSIIGTHVFQHDRVLLSKNLERTLNFWMGSKEPEGVGIENVSRCGWCEFEEGCEWREKKAREAVEANKARKQAS